MDQSIIDWLKTTIPGIILLGAVGSIVAVAVLKTLAWAAARVFPPAKSSILRTLYGFHRGPSLIIEHLRSSQEPRELLVTITLLLSLQIVMGASLAVGVLLIPMGAVSRPQNVDLAQRLVFSGSMLAFVSAFFLAGTARLLFSIYMVHMGEVETRVQGRIAEMVETGKK